MDILKDTGGLTGWLTLFLQLVGSGKSPAEAATEITKQRLPKMFGIGREDERLFETIRQLLTPKARHLVDLVVGEMKDYEANIFRLTVTGMPCGNEIVNKPIGKQRDGQPPVTTKVTMSWEFTVNDLRVKYLEDIADEVSKIVDAGVGEKMAARKVVRAMRSRRLITRHPAAQKAYELWTEMTKWVKANILDFFGVESFNELTDTVMSAKLTKNLEELVRNHPDVLSLREGKIQVKVPGVFSLMAEDIRNFFNLFRR